MERDRHEHPPRTVRKIQLKSTMSPRKSVSFHKNVHIRLTMHIHDYTAEEEEACWYSREDYIEMSNDVRCTANMIEEEESDSTVVFDDVQCCRRGCEKRTQNGAKRTQRHRRKALTAVLSEQYAQVALYGSLDEHCLLAVAYRQYSYRSQQSAYSMGLDDEKIVQPYQEEQEKNHPFSKRQDTARAKKSECVCAMCARMMRIPQVVLNPCMQGRAGLV